jgi:hypothetical protein
MPGGNKVKGKAKTKKNSPGKLSSTSSNRSSRSSSNSSTRSSKRSSNKTTRKNKDGPIPLLSKIKPSISDHNYKYLYELLSKLANLDSHKARDEKKKMYLYNEFDEIDEILKEEIESIQKHSKSEALDFHFITDDKKKMIQQVKAYRKFFKHKVDKLGRVRATEIDVLFD